MIRGEDGELAAARKAMDEKLAHLQSATEYAILGNTEKLQTMSAELKQNDEMQTQMLEEQTKMLETVIEGQDNVRNDLKDIRKLLSVFQEQKREETQVGTQKSARSKPPTSSRVRAFFLDLIDPTHEYRVLKDSLIPEMSTWIFDEPESGSAWTLHQFVVQRAVQLESAWSGERGCLVQQYKCFSKVDASGRHGRGHTKSRPARTYAQCGGIEKHVQTDE